MPALILPFGTLKFARFVMLNNCAMSSARREPNRNDFESRRSTLANPGQSTVVTSVRPRARRAAFTAPTSRSRQPEPGMIPPGRSLTYPSLFKSPNEALGLNRRLERKSAMADSCRSAGNAAMPLRTRR